MSHIYGNATYLVHYYLYRRDDGLVTVLYHRIYHDDEYDETRFIQNSEGYTYIFGTKEEAIEKMHEWFKLEEIDERLRIKP